MDDPKPSYPNNNEPISPTEPVDQPFEDTQTETYETPAGEPTTIAPLPTPLSLQKPKSHAGRWFVRGFVVLLLAGLAAFGYWQWTEAQSANNERASLQSELETVKAANKSNDEKAETPVVTEPKTDKELVKTEVESFLDLMDKNSYVYDPANVKMDEQFAVAKASLPNSGANPKTVVLEKSGDGWVVIYSSFEPLTAAEKTDLTTKFGVTASLME